MTSAFADTFYFLALLDSQEKRHAQAAEAQPLKPLEPSRQMNKHKLLAVFVGCLMVVIALWTLLKAQRPGGDSVIQALQAGYRRPIGTLSEQEKARTKADEVVRRLGTNALPQYIRWLRAKDSPIKARLLRLLEQQHLIRVDTSKMSADWRRFYAYIAISILGPDARAAIPAISQSVRDRRAEEKGAAALLLAGIGREPIGFLTNALHDPDMQVRVAAARGLGAYGETHANAWGIALPPRSQEEIANTARMVVRPLVNALADTNNNNYFRAVAVSALGQIAHDEESAKSAVPVLLRSLEDPDPDVGVMAAQSLGWIAREPSVAVPALAAQVNAGNATLRRVCVEALGRFGSRAESAVPVLLKALDDADANVQHEAAYALGRVKPKTPPE